MLKDRLGDWDKDHCQRFVRVPMNAKHDSYYMTKCGEKTVKAEATIVLCPYHEGTSGSTAVPDSFLDKKIKGIGEQPKKIEKRPDDIIVADNWFGFAEETPSVAQRAGE